MGWTLVLKNSKLSTGVCVEFAAACLAGSAIGLAPEYELFTVAAQNTSSSVALLVPIILTHPWLRESLRRIFTVSDVQVWHRPEARDEGLGRPSRYRAPARARSNSSILRRRERALAIRAPSPPPRRESSCSPVFRAHAPRAP